MSFLPARTLGATLWAASLLYAAVATAQAQDKQPFSTYLSMQGFSGGLNTPVAHVQDEGTLQLQYANQQNLVRGRLPKWQDAYMMSVGFFSFAEIGGRLTYDGVVNDLSANVKLSTAPLKKYSPWIPNVAFGIQDMGGGANHFQTKYFVVSEDIWKLRLSAGYGLGPDRMKGVFGSGEFRAFDWLHLLGEYDTRVTNVGGRLVSPLLPYLPVQLTFTGMTSLENRPGNFSMGVGLSIPLGGEKERGKENRAEGQGSRVKESRAEGQGARGKVETEGKGQQGAVAGAVMARKALPLETVSLAKQDEQELQKLLAQLTYEGFLNVRVGGAEGSTLVVEYENATFNHNELDAMGLVAGLSTKAAGASGHDNLRLVVKKKNIRMLEVQAPAATLATYLQDGGAEGELLDQMRITGNISDTKDIAFVDGDTNSSFLTTTLALWPGLTTWVGTDHGPFDYLLSLKPETFTNLWSGAFVNARWDIPLLWSDNLDRDKPYRNSRKPAQLERLMLFQGVKLVPGLMANFGGGTLLPHLYGTMNELVWQPGDGAHRVRLSQSWGHNSKTNKDADSYLASYRYHFSPLDLSLEATGGKFWSQDTGYSLELRRFFGDAAVSVYYKNSTVQESMRQGLPSHWQAAGIKFSIPLTLPRDMKHYYKMQVRGTDEWLYGQETTLASGNKDNANYLPPTPLAITSSFTGSLHNQYLNRDRLHASYIASNIGRLRKAWLKYRPADN